MKRKIGGIVLAAIMLVSFFSVMVPIGTSGNGFAASVSAKAVNPGDFFFIEGTAWKEGVNILIVSPAGPYGDRIDGLGRGIYHKVASVSDTDNTFSLKVIVGLQVVRGSYMVLVLSPGGHGTYDGFKGDIGVSNLVEALDDQYGPYKYTQDQFLAIINATVDAAGSDDFLWINYVDVGGTGKRPHGACQYSEAGAMFLDMKEFKCDCTYHWTGDAAASLADYIDKNYYSREVPPKCPDGVCSEEEVADYLSSEFKREIKDEIVNNMLIDGTRGDIDRSYCSYIYPGFGAMEEDFEVKCTHMVYWDLANTDDHVYSRTGLKDGDFVSFNAPIGWRISSAEDLKGSSINADNRTVIGIATNNAHVIKFSKVGVPSPSVTLTPVPSPTPTASPAPTIEHTPTTTPSPSPTATSVPATETPQEPGYEAIFAIVGLLVVAYMALRRG